MVVKVAFWYESWTSLLYLCWIIFLFSDLITEQALILLHIDEIEEAPNKRNALASLTDDVIVEILRRLPTRSLFCYKCVCRSWKHLISDSNNHKNLPKTMANPSMIVRTAVDTSPASLVYAPSLEFLPFNIDNVAILDCYNGLILCWCLGADGYRYVCLQSNNPEV